MRLKQLHHMVRHAPLRPQFESCFDRAKLAPMIGVGYV